MKKGFYTIMSAQFFSSLADNALFVAAVELIRTSGGAEWQRAALVPMFALFYVVLAPFLGAISTLFFQVPPDILALYLGFFAGFLLYISAADILPEAHSRQPAGVTIVMTCLGALFIFLVIRVAG